MIEINIFDKPSINNKTYLEDVELVLSSIDNPTSAILSTKNQSTLSFQNCIFKKKISFKFNDDLNYPTSISFFDCHIDSIDGSTINTKEVSIGIYGSFVENFIIRGGNIDNVQINNSLGTYFISKVNSVHISYTEDNLDIKSWAKKRPKETLIKEKKSFYLTNIKKISFYSSEVSKKEVNRLKNSKNIKSHGLFRGFYKVKGLVESWRYLLSQKEKEALNILLNLNYSFGFPHITTKIVGGYIESLSIKGKPEGEIIIEDIKINNIYIHEFSPQGNFNLMAIKPILNEKKVNSKFEIHKSILDNTWLYGIEFKDYKNISFYKSSFANTKISSSTFPNVNKLELQIQSLKNIHYLNDKTSTFYREQYDVFLELQQAFIRLGNVYEAQKMKTVAFNSLEKVIHLNFLNDKAILYLNKWSNNHGVSPSRAFLWFILFTIVFHTLNVLSFESIILSFKSDITFELIKENFKFIFSIANPFHGISSIAPESEITTYTYAISFLSRIFIGYIYFQFVASFRRFGKV